MNGIWTLSFVIHVNGEDCLHEMENWRKGISVGVMADGEIQAETKARLFIGQLAEAVKKEDRKALAQLCRLNPDDIGDEDGVGFDSFCLQFEYQKSLDASVPLILSGP